MCKGFFRILVTGGCGFIGSEFVRQAVAQGYDVVVVDKLTYAGTLKRLEEVEGKYKFYNIDINEKAKLDSIFKKENPRVIIHFAAETHVDRSIRDVTPFIDTNVKGTNTLLDTVRRYDVERFIHISCYDENTRALTVNGLKKFDELEKGEIVFSLNPQTGELEEKKIEEIIVQDYEGRMIHFKDERVDLLVTPNHRIYYQQQFNGANEIYFDEAISISDKTGLRLPKSANWKGIDEEFINVEGVGSVASRDLFYISGWFIGAGFLRCSEEAGVNNRENFLKEEEDESKRFFVGETNSNEQTIQQDYKVFFAVSSIDEKREKLEATLKRLEIKFGKYKGKSEEYVYFSSQYWRDYFAQFEDEVKEVGIPRWILKYDKKYLQCLWEGLVDSSGYKGESDFPCAVISDKLLSSTVELGYKLGYRVFFTPVKTLLNKREVKKRGDYCIYFSLQPGSIGKENAKKEYYKGKIWCVKVEGNKNLIVERNGKFDFCGNTDEVYGEIKKGEFLESSPLSPNSPYSASKAGADLLVRAYIKTYGVRAIIVRPSNCYGKWQYPEKLIPLSILKALRGEKIPVYGDGRNLREWLYVEDCVEGIFALLEKGKVGEIYNLGSGQERENIEVVRQILKILNQPESLIEFVNDRPGHDFRYRLNSQKFYQEIGFKPKTQFEKGLNKTVKWYVDHKKWILDEWSKVSYLYR